MKASSKFTARRTTPQHLTNWMGKPLTITFAGKCIGCGSRVYDGGEDPRGVVPDKHFNTGVVVEGKEFPACDVCNNEERHYNLLIERATRKATRAAHADRLALGKGGKS